MYHLFGVGKFQENLSYNFCKCTPVKARDWPQRLKSRERSGYRGCAPVKARDWPQGLKSREKPGCSVAEIGIESNICACVNYIICMKQLRLAP